MAKRHLRRDRTPLSDEARRDRLAQPVILTVVNLAQSFTTKELIAPTSPPTAKRKRSCSSISFTRRRPCCCLALVRSHRRLAGSLGSVTLPEATAGRSVRRTGAPHHPHQVRRHLIHRAMKPRSNSAAYKIRALFPTNISEAPPSGLRDLSLQNSLHRLLTGAPHPKCRHHLTDS